MGSESDSGRRIAYDEFSMFHENAQEFGLDYSGPPVVRRESVEVADGRHLSSLVWGDKPAEMVLLHGGAQNAHTWDTVALALRRPLVAIDLPGHGHSDGGLHGSLDVTANAADVSTVIRELAPDARGVVGMSLGGLTTLALAEQDPDCLRAVVLVDITPGVSHERAAPIMAFIDGPERFEIFDELLERTIHFNPSRTEASLRRGILHNAEQRPDGSWVWRYARFRSQETGDRAELFGGWDALSSLSVPLMLVRGMRPQSVVSDADEAELLGRQPGARIERVADAGHSVQGDTPIALAGLLDDFLPRP